MKLAAAGFAVQSELVEGQAAEVASTACSPSAGLRPLLGFWVELTQSVVHQI